MEFHVVQGLANPTGVQRWHDYGGLGTPTVFFDGGDSVTGPTDAYTMYRARIEARRSTPPLVVLGAELTLDDATSTGSFVIEIDEVSGSPIPNPEECVVRALVFEDDVYFCCGIGGRDTWGRVARLVVEAGMLETRAAGAGQTVIADFTIEPSWNVANVRAIVFVQRGTSGEVLNATRANVVVTSPVDASSWGRIKSLYFSR